MNRLPLFSLLATLTKQELEKIYELTYKYGWLTATEREQDQLSDRAYMEKARIEGELEPLIDYGLGELENTYVDYMEQGSVKTVMDYVENTTKELNEKLNVGREANTLSRFVQWAFEEDDISELLGNKAALYIEKSVAELVVDNTAYKDFVKSIWSVTEYSYWDILEDEAILFVEDVLSFSSEEEQIDIYEELDFFKTKYNRRPEMSFMIFHENDFFKWLQYKYPIETFIKHYNDTIVVLSDHGTFDAFITETALEQFKETFYINILPEQLDKIDQIYGKDLELQWAKRLSSSFAQMEQSAKGGSLSDKIIGFQIGLTTVHDTGPMASYLLGYPDARGSGQKAKKFLDQLSSDKYVAQWNKELQQATGIRVGASIHLRSALVLLKNFV